MPKVTFQPDDVTVEATDGETIFDIARRAGVSIDTACVGNATCGLCRVTILAGEDNLPPYSEPEQRHLGNTYWLTKIRLSCQCPIAGDVTVHTRTRR